MKVLHESSKRVAEAKLLINARVFGPALASEMLSEQVKAVVRNSRIWVNHFERVGDLLHYFDRFTGEGTSAAFNSLRRAGLQTFEDVMPELSRTFGAWRSDCTRLDDFVIGETYSTRSILAFAGVYDTRSGGILPIGKVGTHRAIFIKATLSGGKYENRWLPDGRSLKYYLKSINGKFSDNYQDNQAISAYPGIPVYAFTRNEPKHNFRFSGVFRCAAVHTEPGQAKWFELRRDEDGAEEVPILQDQYFEDFNLQVQVSAASLKASRLERITSAPRLPKRVKVISYAYVRNSDVVAEALDQAAGSCGGCGSMAPFARTSDGTPYLEVHHRRPLAAGGEDTLSNAVALCPNCHRREHNGPARWPWFENPSRRA